MSVVATVRSAVALAREVEITFMAASVAFYAFFSVIPSLLLALAVGSMLGGDAFAEGIVALTGEYLSASGEAVVNEALTGPSGRLQASATGVLALIWSALKVFRALESAFDRIYRSHADTPILQQFVDGTVVLLTIGLALGLMITVGTVIGMPDVVAVPYLDAVSWLVLIGGLVGVFVPLYYVMPPVSVSIREILPGTATAVAGWLALQALFQLYAANALQYRVYGFVGAVLLFMLWLYIGAVILLFGAAVNVAAADR